MAKLSFDYIENNKERFIDELKSFLRFESVSAQSTHKMDIIKCALWLKEHLAEMGLEAGIIETTGNPIVRAKSKGQSSKRLVIYGHYDVQPPEPLTEWVTPPFEPTIRDGKIYARGATDDKGQLFAHIKGIESVLKTQGSLPCEVIFLAEGEEECRGKSLADYVKKNKAELASYAVVVSDGTMYHEDQPAIAYGLRGVVALELIVKGPNKDMHSGSFGGAVPNPATAAAYIISRCVGPDGKVLIPGFYDSVRPMEAWERQNIERLQFDEDVFSRITGIKKPWGEKSAAILEKMWALPTFEVNGIYGGYMGEGEKTIIPAYAGAKITMRTVPDQDGRKIGQLAADFIKSVCPEFVEIDIKLSSEGASPVLFDINHPAIKTGAEALKAGFGKEPVYVREGGSIAVVETFWQELKAPVLLMGFGSEFDAAHAPNEHFSIDHFINAAKTSAHLIENIF